MWFFERLRQLSISREGAAIGICILGVNLLALLVVWCGHVAPHGAPPTAHVHEAMSDILAREMPRDVRSVEFDLIAGSQHCYLRDGRHEVEAEMGHTPHGTVINASFRREPVSGQWTSTLAHNVGWVTAYNHGESPLYDQDGISADDFDVVVRQCVVAARAVSSESHTRLPSVEERRQSWAAMAAGSDVSASPADGAALDVSTDPTRGGA